MSLARHGRAWRRILLVAGFTAIMVGANALASLGADRPARRLRRARVRRAWARGAARLIGMRVHLEGALPDEPVLLISNHLSYVDIVALMSQVPATFVAKSEVAGWPGIGWVSSQAGTLFIDRNRIRDLLRVIDRMEDLLAAGETVLFFPEGTSSGGKDVWRFKSSLFEAACRADVPVACAALTYVSDSPEDHPTERICWWGDMTFGDHIYALLGVPRFEARIKIAPERIVDADRKLRSARSRAVTERDFVPVSVRAPA